MEVRQELGEVVVRLEYGEAIAIDAAVKTQHMGLKSSISILAPGSARSMIEEDLHTMEDFSERMHAVLTSPDFEHERQGELQSSMSAAMDCIGQAAAEARQGRYWS